MTALFTYSKEVDLVSVHHMMGLFLGQFFEILFRFEGQVVYSAALLADEMVMFVDISVVAVEGTAVLKAIHLALVDQDVQVAVHSPETQMGELCANPIVDHLSSRMNISRLEVCQYVFALFALSVYRFSHSIILNRNDY